MLSGGAWWLVPAAASPGLNTEVRVGQVGEGTACGIPRSCGHIGGPSGLRVSRAEETHLWPQGQMVVSDGARMVVGLYCDGAILADVQLYQLHREPQ